MKKPLLVLVALILLSILALMLRERVDQSPQSAPEHALGMLSSLHVSHTPASTTETHQG